MARKIVIARNKVTKQPMSYIQILDCRAPLAMTDEVMGGHATLGVTNNVIANAVKQSSTSKINHCIDCHATLAVTVA